MKDQTRGSSRSRRQHERAFKDELIAQSLVSGASVAAIAMKGGVNANLLFGAVRCDQFDAFSLEFVVQIVTVVGLVTYQMLWLG